jgi:hypothetical protein
MEINCLCSWLPCSKTEPGKADAPYSPTTPKPLTEKLKDEMTQRYQIPTTAPKSDPCPPQSAPSGSNLPAHTSQLPLNPQKTATSTTSLPVPKRNQKKILVKDDDYAYEMARFYGEVQRRDTLNASVILKSTPFPESPKVSLPRIS